MKSLLVITDTAVPYFAVPLLSQDVESLNGVYTMIYVQRTCNALSGVTCMFAVACMPHTAWRMHVVFSVFETCTMYMCNECLHYDTRMPYTCYNVYVCHTCIIV